MLRRCVILTGVVWVGILAWPSDAEAGIMDWIQELSGPGPSTGNIAMLYTHCSGAGPGAQRPKIMAEGKRFDRKPCLFVDYREFQNSDDDNFPAHVELSFTDVGVVWEFLQQGQVQFGAGLGVMHSESNRVERTRFTLSYARAVVQPLSLIWKRSRWARFYKVYARVTVIPGTMDAADFGVPIGSGLGQSTWSATNDHVASWGSIIDLSELIRR